MVYGMRLEAGQTLLSSKGGAQSMTTPLPPTTAQPPRDLVLVFTRWENSEWHVCTYRPVTAIKKNE